MNPREQRQRHTVVNQLAGDVEAVMEDFARTANAAIHEAARDGRAYTDDKITDVREWMNAADGALAGQLATERAERQAFQARGFVDRLRWLMLGK